MRTAPLLLSVLLLAGCRSGDQRPQVEREPFKAAVSRPRPPLAATPAPADPGQLKVQLIDVGNGDAILVTCPDGDHQLLIDAAEMDQRYQGSSTRFRRFFSQAHAEDDPLEVVVLTHPDGDSMGSMGWVLEHYPVDYYVDNGCTSPFRTWKRLEDTLAKHPPAHYLNVYRAQEHVLDIDFCPRADVSARVLRPTGFGQSPWLDDNSIVVRVDFGQSSFLFMGDAEAVEEQQLLRDPALAALLDVDFLKVARHGADSASSPEFLQAVSPDLAAISCGQPLGINKFLGQPRLQTIQRLEPLVRQREEPVTLMACDGEGERPQEADADTGIFVFVDDPGRWTNYQTSAAVYTTLSEGNLLFLSDGQRIWRESVSPPPSPRPRSESDQ